MTRPPGNVGAALERRDVPFFRLDTDRFPSEVRASFDPSEGLTISDGARSISGKEIKSVWYRRHVDPNLPDDLDSGTREFCRREARMFLEGDPSSIANATLVKLSSGYLARRTEALSTCGGCPARLHAAIYNRDE